MCLRYLPQRVRTTKGEKSDQYELFIPWGYSPPLVVFMVKKSRFYLLSFMRYWNFSFNNWAKIPLKYALPMTLVTLISPERLIGLSWNFGFFPNLVWPTYCENMSPIGDGHWATSGVAYVQCLLDLLYRYTAIAV